MMKKESCEQFPGWRLHIPGAVIRILPGEKIVSVRVSDPSKFYERNNRQETSGNLSIHDMISLIKALVVRYNDEVDFLNKQSEKCKVKKLKQIVPE